VRDIDPFSLRLEGVAPVRAAFRDVATPYHPWTDDNGCNELGDDGYEDLVLKFKVKEIAEALKKALSMPEDEVRSNRSMVCDR